MIQKQTWSEQEDKILKYLHPETKTTNWPFDTQSMKQEYHSEEQMEKEIQNKSSNELNHHILKKQWTQEQDQLVFELHNRFGNKWAIIAEHLKDKDDNCIKNHFYSRLRKGLRKVNKIIGLEFKKIFKEFKIIDLYKIIEASDEKFKETKTFTNEMTDLGHDLKNRLFIYSEQPIQKTEEYMGKMRKFIEDMIEFNKNYKRKSKKNRRYSPMGADSVYRLNIRKCNINILTTEVGQIQQSENSIEFLKPSLNLTIPIEFVVKMEDKISQHSSNMSVQLQRQVEVIKKQISEKFIQTNSKKIKSKNKSYRHFSDDEEQEKNEFEYQKDEKLNHFSQNILKTFKSYYSFKSIRSNSIDDYFFD